MDRARVKRQLTDMIDTWCRAYPEDIFTPPPKGADPILVTQCSAAMGRYMAGKIKEQIDAIFADDGTPDEGYDHKPNRATREALAEARDGQTRGYTSAELMDELDKPEPKSTPAELVQAIRSTERVLCEAEYKGAAIPEAAALVAAVRELSWGYTHGVSAKTINRQEAVMSIAEAVEEMDRAD